MRIHIHHIRVFTVRLVPGRLCLGMLCAGVLCGAAMFAQTPTFSEREPRYQIQPSDTMEIHYRYSPEFDQTATVQPDGFVDLRLVGELKVQGLTVDQAKSAIVEKASQRLKDPEIAVELKDFEKPYFTVGGEVNHPGRFEMRGSMTPLQAIAMAGGFNNSSAKHSQVILLRRVGPDLAKTQILNLKAAMKPSAKEQPADLQSGDMLIVPQNSLSKLERLVKIGNLGAYIPIK
jgi:polysaccharide export outer membrane protein